MEKLRFEFVMKAAADKKSNALMVTSITTPDGEIFDIPAELQEVSLHTELMKTDIYKKIKNTNLKRNQKRNVWILLNAEIKSRKEENKKSRLCIDFRDLNKMVVPQSQPFPLIEDLVIKTRNCKYFSTLDVNSAFWSIPLRVSIDTRPDSLHKRDTSSGPVLPFGLKTSPAIFQRIMSNIIRKNDLAGFTVCYIDDLLIFSKTFNEHIDHLKKLFQAIKKEGFRLKFSKCAFAKDSVKHLNGRILFKTISTRFTMVSLVRVIYATRNFYQNLISKTTSMSLRACASRTLCELASSPRALHVIQMRIASGRRRSSAERTAGGGGGSRARTCAGGRFQARNNNNILVLQQIDNNEHGSRRRQQQRKLERIPSPLSMTTNCGEDEQQQQLLQNATSNNEEQDSSEQAKELLSSGAEMAPILAAAAAAAAVNNNNNGGEVPRPLGLHQMEHLQRIRDLVKAAIASRHTFMIHGRARIIRESLLGRNWCEKFQRKPGQANGAEQQYSPDSSPSALLSGLGNLDDRQNERLLISRMLGSHTPDLLWNSGSEWTGWPSQDNKATIFNRFTRASFTSKVGLCANIRQMQWIFEAGVADCLFPRCYNLGQPDQLQAFVEDFRLTACLSLLKWLVERVRVGGEDSLRLLPTNGSSSTTTTDNNAAAVPLRALDFAVGRCSDFVGSQTHEDIDRELESVWSHQWDQFMGWYYKLVHGDGLLAAGNVPIRKYVLAARHLLKKAAKYWPQLQMDGWRNVWILKPGNKSRGRGIVLLQRLDDILSRIGPSGKAGDTRYVIQKYIERPLLIYETKFDIRQWFIVTSAQPLTLWMYRSSYLRFCSQKFSLTDLHESVHLSNNAVQCKYKVSPERDPLLPPDNMWDSDTFKEWLRARGQPHAWDELIYPGMRRGLVGSLLASQEAMDRRRNSFELYGADFMLMEDFSVWLIEINSHPDMSNSTSVTSRLCRRVLEDTVRLVVDHREDPQADTGDFELAYRQRPSPCQSYLAAGLRLHGQAVGPRNAYGSHTGAGFGPVAGRSRRQSHAAAAAAAAASAGVSVNDQTSGGGFKGANHCRLGPVLVDLIEDLEMQLDREFSEYLRLRPASGLQRVELPPGCPALDPAVAPETDAYVFNVETSTANSGAAGAGSGGGLVLAASSTAYEDNDNDNDNNEESYVDREKQSEPQQQQQTKPVDVGAPKTAPETTTKPTTRASRASRHAQQQQQPPVPIQSPHQTATKPVPKKPPPPPKVHHLVPRTAGLLLLPERRPQTRSPTTVSIAGHNNNNDNNNNKNNNNNNKSVSNSGGSSSKPSTTTLRQSHHHLRQAKRYSRGVHPSQVYVDLSDMYALGLGVNKTSS
ncbi:unnamed protein product [Trichogramma brassicae]|uniref:Reverse transcriptase domain-containing protein n=1 Tax=Trichogramma brassicae TaxID=86971 RepID=A0A6H5HV98_9HYME|nr:unnamed protein product [Trichogramma brassicae]